MYPLRPNKSLGLVAARGKREGKARQDKTRQPQDKTRQRQAHLVFLFSMHCILRFVSLIRDERQTRQVKTRQVKTTRHDKTRQNITQHKIKQDSNNTRQSQDKTLSQDKTTTRQDEEDVGTCPPKLKTPQTSLPDNPVLREFKEEQKGFLVHFSILQ